MNKYPFIGIKPHHCKPKVDLNKVFGGLTGSWAGISHTSWDTPFGDFAIENYQMLYETMRVPDVKPELLWMALMSRFSDEQILDLIDTDQLDVNKHQIALLAAMLESFATKTPILDILSEGTTTLKHAADLSRTVWATSILEMERRHRKASTLVYYATPLLEGHIDIFLAYREEYVHLRGEGIGAIMEIRKLYNRKEQ